MPDMVDWKNKDSSVTMHFTVADCLTLHHWNRLATEADGADLEKLTFLCEKLEDVRFLLNSPMRITSMFRSIEYNQNQGIVPNLDVHSQSLACDFTCEGLTTDEIKSILMPHLEHLGLRMEDNGSGAAWCHIDCHLVVVNRFFKP